MKAEVNLTPATGKAVLEILVRGITCSPHVLDKYQRRMVADFMVMLITDPKEIESIGERLERADRTEELEAFSDAVVKFGRLRR